MNLMRQELHVCEQLEHPHIVRVLDLFEDDANIYIVMEYISGGNLLDMMTRDKVCKITEKEIGSMIHQIMLALNYMHARGIIHRDLKLENILVQQPLDQDKPPMIKLCDFGFACFKELNQSQGLRLGSPHYMAPEVVQFQEYDDRVDVWSLGVITYMCLMG